METIASETFSTFFRTFSFHLLAVQHAGTPKLSRSTELAAIFVSNSQFLLKRSQVCFKPMNAKQNTPNRIVNREKLTPLIFFLCVSPTTNLEKASSSAWPLPFSCLNLKEYFYINICRERVTVTLKTTLKLLVLFLLFLLSFRITADPKLSLTVVPFKCKNIVLDLFLYLV